MSVAARRKRVGGAIAVIVLRARNNTFETLQSLMPDVVERLARIEPRSLVKVGN